MKTLSLLQPWATFVELGLKRIETRSWQTSYRGSLLIHASSARLNAGRQLYAQVTGLDADRPEVAALPLNFDDLSAGKIVCQVDLFAIQRTDHMGNPSQWDLRLGDFSVGRYAWHLKMMRRFDQNYPTAKGRLGLWEFPDEFLPPLET